ncbi:MAG: PAS domain S-box protein, partial [Candidatus Binatia bacterium]
MRTRTKKTQRPGEYGAKATEVEFSKLFEFAPDAIVAVNRQGRIVRTNSHTEKMFGYKRAALLGKPVEILLPERFRERHVGHRADYSANAQIRPMGSGLDFYGQRKDGSEFPVDINLSPMETEEGMLVIAIIRDITDRKRAEEQVQINLERIQALREIDQAITSTLDLRAVLNVLMEKIDVLLPYSAVLVWLLNRESGLLERTACRNLNEEEWKGRKLPGMPSLVEAAIETKAPVVASNVQTDPRTLDPEFYRRHGLVSYLGIPLLVKGEVLGILVFLTREEHQFTNEEIEFLSTLAGQAAIAIHNSQLYEEM